MNKSGLVLKIEKRTALLITSSGEFVSVSSRGTSIRPKVGALYTGARINKINYLQYLTAAVSLFLILTFSGSYYLYYTPVSAVEIDINPSVELITNCLDRIIKILPLNADGKTLLESMNLKNKNIDEGLTLVIEKAKEDNFINSDYIAQGKTVSVKITSAKAAAKPGDVSLTTNTPSAGIDPSTPNTPDASNTIDTGNTTNATKTIKLDRFEKYVEQNKINTKIYNNGKMSVFVSKGQIIEKQTLPSDIGLKNPATLVKPSTAVKPASGVKPSVPVISNSTSKNTDISTARINGSKGTNSSNSNKGVTITKDKNSSQSIPRKSSKETVPYMGQDNKQDGNKSTTNSSIGEEHKIIKNVIPNIINRDGSVNQDIFNKYRYRYQIEDKTANQYSRENDGGRD